MLYAVARRVGAGLRRDWRRWLAGLLIGLAGPATAEPAADPARVQVLLSDSGGVYGELITALQDRLDALAPGRVDLQWRLVPEAPETRRALFDERPALVVTIGIRASALSLQVTGPVPVLSLLVPYDSYNTLRAQAGPQHSAIYLDQPLARQLDLLQLLLPKVQRVGTLAGPHSAPRLEELQALSARRDLRLISATVAGGANPVPAVGRLVDDAEVLLALPDPAVFNRASLQAILLTTYRSGVPVLGFSQAYVRAGALAAVHSTALHIGSQAGEWIAQLANDGVWQLGPPRHPAYYAVAVNAQVAQTLGISVADERTLLERLRRLERVRDGQTDGQPP